METQCQRLAFLLPHLQLPRLLHVDVHVLLVRRQRLAGLLATLECLLGCRLHTKESTALKTDALACRHLACATLTTLQKAGMAQSATSCTGCILSSIALQPPTWTLLLVTLAPSLMLSRMRWPAVCDEVPLSAAPPDAASEPDDILSPADCAASAAESPASSALSATVPAALRLCSAALSPADCSVSAPLSPVHTRNAVRSRR